MRYVQLRAFHNVAIHGGFSRAAEQLNLTQPAISDQVRRLEEEYDILLFNRHKKQVVLTPQGEDLLAITRRLFDTEDRAREMLSESRAMRAGTLRIIADSAQHVLKILARFRQTWPEVAVTIHSGNSETVIGRLLRYESDIGVLGDVPPGRDFETIRLDASPICAFVARDHPLAGRSALDFDDLVGQTLVLRETGSRTRTSFEAAARARGHVFPAAITAEGREAVREIVASGTGIGFVSAAEFGADARLVRLDLPEAGEMVMQESVICLRDRRNAKLVHAFMKTARAMAHPNAWPGKSRNFFR